MVCLTCGNRDFRYGEKEKSYHCNNCGGRETTSDNMDKNIYIGIVKFTLESMLDLSKSDNNYNLNADVIHYYETTIKAENKITQEEFLELCKNVGIR